MPKARSAPALRLRIRSRTATPKQAGSQVQLTFHWPLQRPFAVRLCEKGANRRAATKLRVKDPHPKTELSNRTSRDTVLCAVLLVVVLRHVELRGRRDLRHDLPVELCSV